MLCVYNCRYRFSEISQGFQSYDFGTLLNFSFFSKLREDIPSNFESHVFRIWKTIACLVHVWICKINEIIAITFVVLCCVQLSLVVHVG